MKRYYICLMQYSLANLGVQLFTIYIFFDLTRKKSQKVIDKYSVLTSDSIKRISMLETDKQTNKEPDQKHRSNSLTTQDMQGYDDGLTNNDRHNTYMSENSPQIVAHEDMVVEETPDFQNKMN